MKKNLLLFVAAAIVLGLAVRKVTEGFGTEAEFLDKKQVLKTVLTEDSSYDQRTNHMEYAPYSVGQIEGMPTPFRVNMFNAYVV